MANIGPDLAAQMWHRLVSRRTALAQVNARTEFQAKDGLGGEGMSITMDEYAANQVMYGDQCWLDPEFRKAWARDNPECCWKASRGCRGQEYAGTRYLTKKPPELPRGTLFVPPSYAT